MLQQDRNTLYNIAYGLDNETRLWIPKRLLREFRPVSSVQLAKLRMQDKEDSLFVLFESRKLESVADNIRTLVALDEATLSAGRRSR
jgi:hypothetical protein